MSLKLSEEEFNKLLSKNKIKINSNSINKVTNDNKKISIKNNKNIKENTTKTVDFDKIINSIVNSTYEFGYNENEIYIVLNGARLLSLNQILSFLQQKPTPFRMMKYKKTWHEKMSLIINDILIDSIEHNKKLPNFNGSSVELLLYRESLKLIDEDSISASFKYIIDSLRKEHIFLNKKYRILLDDNQMFVSNIIPFQVKNKNNNIGIRIIKKSSKKNVTNLDDFLKLK